MSFGISNEEIEQIFDKVMAEKTPPAVDPYDSARGK